MGILANIKGQQAYMQHGKGNFDEALRLYEEAYKAGMDNPRNLLAYSSLLIRKWRFQEARDLLVKIQKTPGMNPEQKMQLFCNYAACVCKLGEVEKGVAILERQHAKAPTGLVYETLGCLYVELCVKKPTAEEEEAALAAAAAQTENTEAVAEGEAPAVPAEPTLTPMQKWEKNVEKAKAFLLAALDYDDEDSVCLDNLGQFYYRVLEDKEAARTYFEKALEVKDSQIDTLWFLSRYDLDAGDTQKAIARLQKAMQGRFSPLNYATREMVTEELKRLGAKVDDD